MPRVFRLMGLVGGRRRRKKTVGCCSEGYVEGDESGSGGAGGRGMVAMTVAFVELLETRTCMGAPQRLATRTLPI